MKQYHLFGKGYHGTQFIGSTETLEAAEMLVDGRCFYYVSVYKTQEDGSIKFCCGANSWTDDNCTHHYELKRKKP